MKRRLRYVILLTVVVSIVLYKMMTSVTYPSDDVAIDIYLDSLDITYSETSDELRIQVDDPAYKFVIYGDTLYEAKAYLPMAATISKNLRASVRICSYNFLGNMQVIGDDPSDEIIITHGNGSEWLRFVSSKAKGVIVLGNTGDVFKFTAKNCGVIIGGLDMVSTYSNEVVPEGSVVYKIEKGNFSNYVYAAMHSKDATSLITREEQITLATNYINDFVSSLVD